MFKILKNAKEFADNKDKYQEFRKNQLEFFEFIDNRADFDEYLKFKDAFAKYRSVVGDGTTPFFMMYAADIDLAGNITFNYDFNPDFIQLLKQQGMHGIEDIEILEEYLHVIYSQNYFAEMFAKAAKQEDE